MPDTKAANITPEKLRLIQELEKQLGDDVSLVAIEKTGFLYVLEAKLASNVWERVDTVYPELENLKAYFTSKEDAHLTKSSLKKLLMNNKKLKKRPIRLRKIE